MKEIKNWDKIKNGQVIMQIYSDGSGLLNPRIFYGMKRGFPLLGDFFEEIPTPSLANIPDTKFYKPDKWYWKFLKWHLLELKSAYGRYCEQENRLNVQYDKVCQQRENNQP